MRSFTESSDECGTVEALLLVAGTLELRRNHSMTDHAYSIVTFRRIEIVLVGKDVYLSSHGEMVALHHKIKRAECYQVLASRISGQFINGSSSSSRGASPAHCGDCGISLCFLAVPCKLPPMWSAAHDRYSVRPSSSTP